MLSPKNALEVISYLDKIRACWRVDLAESFFDVDRISVEQRAKNQLAIYKEGEKIIAELKAELDKHRWIPVSERLPELIKGTVSYESGYVFVTNGMSARVAYWMTRQKYWRFVYGLGWPNPITHWKPIILP